MQVAFKNGVHRSSACGSAGSGGKTEGPAVEEERLRARSEHGQQEGGFGEPACRHRSEGPLWEADQQWKVPQSREESKLQYQSIRASLDWSPEASCPNYILCRRTFSNSMAMIDFLMT